MCGCLSCTSYWGPGPQTRHVPQTGNPTGGPLVCQLALNPLSHTNQGWRNSFISSTSFGSYQCQPSIFLFQSSIHPSIHPSTHLFVYGVFTVNPGETCWVLEVITAALQGVYLQATNVLKILGFPQVYQLLLSIFIENTKLIAKAICTPS